MKDVDYVVIGAGVIGLACALALAKKGRKVWVLEAASAIGTGISSRNSEVLHAGLYYPPGSLKAKLCVRGRALLQEYASARGIPHTITGKLIVATQEKEEKDLLLLHERALANGVNDIVCLSGAQAMAMEPELSCRIALLSPSTGIIDSHALMLALQGEFEDRGGTVVFRAKVTGGQTGKNGTDIYGHSADNPQDNFHVKARTTILAAGLSSPSLARGLGLKNVPRDYLCKGHYFALSGPLPFTRLIYPIPSAAGLGIHYTLDGGGRAKFGPDTEWIEQEDYTVEEALRTKFYDSIRRYWPGCQVERLHPSYAGIRPKIVPSGSPAGDFIIDRQGDIIALYGIESPGLTSSLALAEYVASI